jgi:hypothetical protein
VCHRDLKPENLLLDEHENLKISDFGLSSLYEQAAGETDRATLLHTTCGTPNYVAPEVLADRGYDGAQADTWSIGVILFVFLAGFLPFDEATMSALFRKIQKADFTYPSWFQEDAKDLIGKILVVDPKQRWTIPQIKQHPWWKKDGPYALEDPTAGGRPPEQSATGELLDDVDDEDAPKAGGGGAPATGAGGAADTKRINAFDLINMCSGSSVGRLFQSEAERKVAKTIVVPSSKPLDVVMKAVQVALAGVPGFVEQSVYNDDDKLRAVYDLGHGQVHVKVAIEVAADDLVMVVFKRARGDLISFGKVWEHIQRIAQSVA